MTLFRNTIWATAVLCVTGVASADTLIDNSTLNGSFELAGGVTNTFKIKGWDTGTFDEGPDQGLTVDIDNWTYWSGPEDDSGVQPATSATDGDMMAFLQADNGIYNLTSYSALEGDLFYFSWHHVKRGQRLHEVSLVYDDNGTITEVPGSKMSSIAQGPNDDSDQDFFYEKVFTIPSGSPAIGSLVGLGVHATGGYPELDEFLLQVNELVPPEGDVNEDFAVDLVDYGIIRDNFLLSPATKGEGDIAGADIVDLDDFLLWRNNYTPPSAAQAAAAVPEPATIVLALAGLALVAGAKGRRA